MLRTYTTEVRALRSETKRNIYITAMLFLLCAMSVFGQTCTESGTTVTLAGTTYHLCASPRVGFNPALATLMTGTSGSGRFQTSSVTEQRLAGGFATYCSTLYGYLNAQAYDDLESGPPLICGAIAASLWMSNGSNLSDTTYLPVAMWAITHAEEIDLKRWWGAYFRADSDLRR
jgi:hypothetical protein